MCRTYSHNSVIKHYQRHRTHQILKLGVVVEPLQVLLLPLPLNKMKLDMGDCVIEIYKSIGKHEK